ncbi:MAG TPA: hypothetical protein VFF06_33670 [Polyangia bacterium]|nr:hypothetical protein [Polyangia bacterium]
MSGEDLKVVKDPPAPPRPRRLIYGLAAALALLAAVESAQAMLGARATPAADWDAAAAEVRAEFHDGDLIVFAPAWADPIGRAHLGDKVSVEMAGRADADRYARVWEVSIRGARAPETRGLTAERTTRHGRVTVALYRKPAVEVAYDFTSHIDEARVTHSAMNGANESPCYKDVGARAGFRCPGTRVEGRTLEVDYQPRRGILAPAAAGRITAIEFSDVTLGRELIGYTGLSDFNSRKNGAGPVDLRVIVDGRERLRVRQLNDEPWKRFTVDTGTDIAPKHVVRFEISAPVSTWRTFGFHAEARTGPLRAAQGGLQ